MKKAWTLFLALLPYTSAMAAELTVEACASATVTSQTPTQVMSGFPETCIYLSADSGADYSVSFRKLADTEQRSLALGGCNTSGTDVDVTIEHRFRYDIVTNADDWQNVNVRVAYDLVPDVYSDGSGSHVVTSQMTIEDGICVDGFPELSASYQAVYGYSNRLVDDTDVSGLYHDPDNPGHGFDFNVHEAGFTAYYYGHTADGERLWLISGLLADDLEYYETYVMDMYEIAEGEFGAPGFNPELWGTVELTFYDCNSAWARFDGRDGEISMSLERIVGLRSSGCSPD